jgi:hypothetical protein
MTPAYRKPILERRGLPLVQTPAIAFPAETTRGGKGRESRRRRGKAAVKACKAKLGWKRVKWERNAERRYGGVKKRTKA